MPKFLVQNLTNHTVSLGIEPWADLELLPPKARIEFDYDEPAQVGFSFDRDGGATVSVMTDRLKVSVNGREKTHNL